MLNHGYVPKELTRVVLMPIIKSKSGDIKSKDNYRPIALASVMSKVLELVLIDISGSSLDTTDHQFVFKQGHSTDTCIFVLKQVIEYYNRLGSPVFVAL